MRSTANKILFFSWPIFFCFCFWNVLLKYFCLNLAKYFLHMLSYSEGQTARILRRNIKPFQLNTALAFGRLNLIGWTNVFFRTRVNKFAIKSGPSIRFIGLSFNGDWHSINKFSATTRNRAHLSWITTLSIVTLPFVSFIYFELVGSIFQ